MWVLAERSPWCQIMEYHPMPGEAKQVRIVCVNAFAEKMAM